MLTAKDIRVGNFIEHPASSDVYEIVHVYGFRHDSMFCVDMRSRVDGCKFTHYEGFCFGWSVVNTNTITVSSLDYTNSTELDDQDKEIIKEYLNAQV